MSDEKVTILKKRKRDEEKERALKVFESLSKKPKICSLKTEISTKSKVKSFLERAKMDCIEKGLSSEPKIVNSDQNDVKENENKEKEVEMNIICGVFEKREEIKLISEVGEEGKEKKEEKVKKKKVKSLMIGEDLNLTNVETPKDKKEREENEKSFLKILDTFNVKPINKKKK